LKSYPDFLLITGFAGQKFSVKSNSGANFAPSKYNQKQQKAVTITMLAQALAAQFSFISIYDAA